MPQSKSDSGDEEVKVNAAIAHFTSLLAGAISHTSCEFDISYEELIGVLEVAKYRLLAEAHGHDDE